MKEDTMDAAQVGRMFVTKVTFEYHHGGQEYNGKTGKYDTKPGRWDIMAYLNDKPSSGHYGGQSMNLTVEQGIGNKLAEVLLPVVLADASRKADQLAQDSKAMMVALGERAKLCITDMPKTEAETPVQVVE